MEKAGCLVKFPDVTALTCFPCWPRQQAPLYRATRPHGVTSRNNNNLYLNLHLLTTGTGSWQGRRCGQLQARLVMKMKRKKMNLHQYCHLPFLRPLPQPVCIASYSEARQSHVMLVPDLRTQ